MAVKKGGKPAKAKLSFASAKDRPKKEQNLKHTGYSDVDRNKGRGGGGKGEMHVITPGEGKGSKKSAET